MIIQEFGDNSSCSRCFVKFFHPCVFILCFYVLWEWKNFSKFSKRGLNPKAGGRLNKWPFLFFHYTHGHEPFVSWDVDENCASSLSSSSGCIPEKGTPQSPGFAVSGLISCWAITVRKESSDFLTWAGQWPVFISKTTIKKPKQGNVEAASVLRAHPGAVPAELAVTLGSQSCRVALAELKELRSVQFPLHGQFQLWHVLG